MTKIVHDIRSGNNSSCLAGVYSYPDNAVVQQVITASVSPMSFAYGKLFYGKTVNRNQVKEIIKTPFEIRGSSDFQILFKHSPRAIRDELDNVSNASRILWVQPLSKFLSGDTETFFEVAGRSSSCDSGYKAGGAWSTSLKPQINDLTTGDTLFRIRFTADKIYLATGLNDAITESSEVSIPNHTAFKTEPLVLMLAGFPSNAWTTSVEYLATADGSDPLLTKLELSEYKSIISGSVKNNNNTDAANVPVVISNQKNGACVWSGKTNSNGTFLAEMVGTPPQTKVTITAQDPINGQQSTTVGNVLTLIATKSSLIQSYYTPLK